LSRCNLAGQLPLVEGNLITGRLMVVDYPMLGFAWWGVRQRARHSKEVQ